MDDWFFSHAFHIKNYPGGLVHDTGVVEAYTHMPVFDQMEQYIKNWSHESPVPINKFHFIREHAEDFRFTLVTISKMHILCIEVMFSDIHAVEFKLKFDTNDEILTVDNLLDQCRDANYVDKKVLSYKVVV